MACGYATMCIRMGIGRTMSSMRPSVGGFFCVFWSRCWVLSVAARMADFAQHFRDILKKNSPEPRPFRVHMTSVVVRPDLSLLPPSRTPTGPPFCRSDVCSHSRSRRTPRRPR